MLPKWILVGTLFVIICWFAIVQNVDPNVENNQCGGKDGLPTISSSLMRSGTSYRALVIALFTISLFLFIHVKDKSLLVSLHLFMLAFVVNMNEGKSDAETHMDLVLSGAVIMYFSVVYNIFFEAGNILLKVFAGVVSIVSIIFGVLFCVNVWNDNMEPCDDKMIYEYLWLGPLLLSTIIVVVHEENNNYNKTAPENVKNDDEGAPLLERGSAITSLRL